MWQVRDRFLDLKTRWLTLIGENLETDQGEVLEYWRVEKPHSVIVLPLLENAVVLPNPMYRPGIGQATLDLPGGRLPPDQTVDAAAQQILRRELALPEGAIDQLTQLTPDGWPINSAFSNQRLYGLVAQLDASQPPQVPYLSFGTDQSGLQSLLNQLLCLQCRAVVREWQALVLSR